MSAGPVGVDQGGRAGAPPEARLFGRRSRLVLVVSSLYVAAAALREADGRGLRAWVAGLIALGLAWAAGEHEPWTALAEWGLAVAVAAFGAPDAPTAGGWVSVLGVMGAGAAAIAGTMSISRVAAPAGMARPKRSSAVLGLVVVGGLFAFALTARVLRACGGHGVLADEADLLSAFMCVLAGAFLVGEAWDTSRVRRLELGVAARMHAAGGLGVATAGAAFAVCFARFAAAEPVARVAVALGALLICRVSRYGDPVTLARASRRAVALTIVGGPIVTLGVGVADGRPGDAAAVVAVFGVLALVLGASAAWFEEPLRPARGAWLDAVASAHEALLRTDPDEAIREALVALRVPAGLSAASPELWSLDPPGVTTVDAAGYARMAKATEASLPEGIVATAAKEPETILRQEVLAALSVRHPELRPLARWMDDRGAMLAAVVTRGGEAEGLLVLPRGKRTEALSLEEARAIKRLADSLAALCHARAALARSLERERQATVKAEAADAAMLAAKRELERREAQGPFAVERLARGAATGVYSASARLAADAIDDAARGDHPLFVHAPSGIDPVPYLARAHLLGPRRGEPLVVVDGTSSAEHHVARWTDRTASPMALADRGRLVVVDGAALPAAVQELVAAVQPGMRSPWGTILDVVLTVTATSPYEDLASNDLLAPSLSTRLASLASASLPRLRDRPEDLRSIVSDALAREGLRVRGTPVGIDDAAFSRLLDHPFDGELAELASLVQRLVAACEGDVVRARLVDLLLAPEGRAAPPRASVG
jgi:hypothetical protein